MGDKLSKDKERDGLFVRTISFSVRIPTHEGQVILWAQSTAASMSDAFLCLEAFLMRQHREGFLRRTCAADRDEEYERWFLDHLRATELDLEAQRRVSWGGDAPLFSVIVPLFRTPIEYLSEMADSVLQQTYPNLELLLVNASPEDAALADTAALIDPCPDLCGLIEKAINPDAPLIITEGNIIREGYSEELDTLRRFSTDGRQMLLDLEAREREKTGIKNLKVLFNRVFGYYIEVTKSNLSLVPDSYIRRQTLANAERYTTDELRALESRLTGTQEKAMKLESELFEGVRQAVADRIGRLQSTAEGFKTLDALLSLARVASENRYVCPEITDDGVLEIADGRHPVVEQMMPEGEFVPNDTFMDTGDRRMHIITGPNMAGKSTYMRQVALITLMAHMGSFVPASRARVPLTDCVYTRVGASDDLAGGQSTFMVEMSEMAYILRSATSRSLVILDEIGRGTSTFDGLAIAWSAVEYLCDKKKSGARVLFATHYHELSELEGHQEGVVNFCVAVKEMGEEVLFLRKIRPGGADKSFGIYVARLAGVPKAVVSRAQEIEARLEVSHEVEGSLGQNILTAGKKQARQQMDLLGYSQTEFVEEVRALDVMAMTPMDALNKLFLLKEKALKL